jgi:ParB family chromosome partitioning protein
VPKTRKEYEIMEELKYLPVSQLFSYPDNPRKDVGDVSELADSIRSNGILQNLTVVQRSQNVYSVIIGHRRLAAAKKAGLETVPCIVRKMTPQEEIRTMLMENMQRCDLTVYEQAQSFQLMLDMGESVEQIAEQSGFSQTTVHNRLRLMDLDAEKFKKSESRGATLADYMKLNKIEDVELKNRVLDYIGTANFQNELRRAVEEEETRNFMTECVADISQWATNITGKPIGSDLLYVRCYNKYSWGRSPVVECPDDANTVKYYYQTDRCQVNVYKERSIEEKNQRKEEQERKAEAEAACRRKEAELKEITDRHFELRSEFVAEYNPRQEDVSKICDFAVKWLLKFKEKTYHCFGFDPELLADIVGYDIETDSDDMRDMFSSDTMYRPEQKLLFMIYLFCENDMGFWARKWNNAKKVFQPVYAPNTDLEKLYDFLVSLGYEMSDEEIAMRDGTHPLLQDSEDENGSQSADNSCELCKSAHPWCDKCCNACEDECNANQRCRKGIGVSE